jgi:glycosyltransferase involved in cell wall biosynthesis
MVAEYDEADCIVVPSTFAYETFRDVGYPEDRLFINPLGVDIHRFRPPSSPEGTFRVVFLGRGSVQKGVVYLLRAWRRLDLPGGELILAGPIEPGAKEILHRELQRVRAGTVRIVGPVGNPEAVLRESSVLVLPSVQDGFGLVVLEAMACGVPVIVSENVGAKDCVREGIDGFVVPVRDADAIAARLEWLHGHPTQRGGMGARARERAMSYSWDAYRSRLAEKIQALADRRTPAGSGQ